MPPRGVGPRALCGRASGVVRLDAAPDAVGGAPAPVSQAALDRVPLARVLLTRSDESRARSKGERAGEGAGRAAPGAARPAAAPLLGRGGAGSEVKAAGIAHEAPECSVLRGAVVYSAVL